MILDFPPGAVEDEIDVTVTPVDSPDGMGFVPGTTFDFGPNGADFLEPVTVTIAYDPADVGGSEGDLQLAKAIAADDFERKPTAPVDTVGDRVVGQLRGFSTIGVHCCTPWDGPGLSATWNPDRTITLEWRELSAGPQPPVRGVELQRAALTGTLRQPVESEWTTRANPPGTAVFDDYDTRGRGNVTTALVSAAPVGDGEPRCARVIQLETAAF